MEIMLGLSAFWVARGIACFLGFQHIPSKYKGHNWTNDYVRCNGISWLMLGIPSLAFCLVKIFCLNDRIFNFCMDTVIYVVVLIPALIYALLVDKRFKKLLEKENGNRGNEL